MTVQIPFKRNDWVFHTGPWMSLTICVVVDESKCLDTPILEFSIICEHLPFSFGYTLILQLLLVHIATRQSGDDIHDLGGCHLRCWRSLFSEFCTRARVVFYNITTEHNLTFVFLVLCLQFSIFRWQLSINDAKWIVAPVVLASSITCFWLLTCQVPRRNFLQFFPFFVHRCFCCRNFHSRRHRKKLVDQIVVL